MNRTELMNALRHYNTAYSEEQEFIGEFLNLLRHPQAYQRDHLPGHMTGSAWIIDESHQFVLLLHHKKLNRWLQPGGHADGDENIAFVARKEAEEETGLKDIVELRNGIFDIDIHTIPARNDFPEHKHFDIRILFQGYRDGSLIGSEESNDLAWVPFEKLPEKTGHNGSILRMAGKVQKLFPC